MTFTAEDRDYMSRALQLAWRGRYTTDPNPRVGCVLVRGGHEIGAAWHLRAGEPHAERLALEAAGDARGATCYVTLEPCSHTGRTGPCAQALIEAGVTRVVAAVKDPNPEVGGQGLRKLEAAGISVESGLLEEEARSLNAGFFRRMHTGRPLVRLKTAMSLDGRTAMASGESQWITGVEAREDVQRLRARSSAIVTGSGTVLADRPSLTVRPADWTLAEYGDGPVRQPLRVVLDSRLRTPPDAPVVTGEGACLIVTAADAEGVLARALQNAGAEVIALPAAGGDNVDLAALLDELGRRECNEVLVEAGPVLGAAFLRARLVDELVVYMATMLMGSSARPMLALEEIATMDQRRHLALKELRHLGDDLRMILTPQ